MGYRVAAARRNPGALDLVCSYAALFLHLGPFSRFVIGVVDHQIRAIDAGEPWVLGDETVVSPELAQNSTHVSQAVFASEPRIQPPVQENAA